jgi:hypothetical protein
MAGVFTLKVVPTSRSGAAMTDVELEISLTILDPCEVPQVTVTFAAVDPVIYTLSEDLVTIPTVWTVVPSTTNTTPAECLVTYLNTIPTALGTDPAINAEKVKFDADTQTFTIAVTNDPSMASNTAVTLSVLPKSRGLVDFASATHQLDVTLTILDPCENPQVTVSAVAVVA